MSVVRGSQHVRDITVLGAVESWLGEELTPQNALRIVTGPVEHVQALVDTVFQFYENRPRERFERAHGTRLFLDLPDIESLDDSSLKRSLVYQDAVVVHDPCHLAWRNGEAVNFARYLRSLAELRPLIHSGTLRLVPSDIDPPPAYPGALAAVPAVRFAFGYEPCDDIQFFDLPGTPDYELDFFEGRWEIVKIDDDLFVDATPSSFELTRTSAWPYAPVEDPLRLLFDKKATDVEELMEYVHGRVIRELGVGLVDVVRDAQIEAAAIRHADLLSVSGLDSGRSQFSLRLRAALSSMRYSRDLGFLESCGVPDVADLSLEKLTILRTDESSWNDFARAFRSILDDFVDRSTDDPEQTEREFILEVRDRLEPRRLDMALALNRSRTLGKWFAEVAGGIVRVGAGVATWMTTADIVASIATSEAAGIAAGRLSRATRRRLARRYLERDLWGGVYAFLFPARR